MGKNLYMHTMNGVPAFYDKKSGLIFFANYSKGIDASKLFVKSLSTIRRQQGICIGQRAIDNNNVVFRYGHLLVKFNDNGEHSDV